jgi:hypothetical protein
MDILGTKNIRFEKEFDYLEKCMCKRNGAKTLNDYIRKEDMIATKFLVMEHEMMPCVG